MSPTYSKEQLVALIVGHADIEVRRCAAESLYSLGVLDGGKQIFDARARALDMATGRENGLSQPDPVPKVAPTAGGVTAPGVLSSTVTP